VAASETVWEIFLLKNFSKKLKALEEISRGHRSNARLIIILITDGHSQDEWSKVQIASQKLRNTTNEV